MNPENMHLYLSILAPMLTLLCTTVVFLQKFVKNKKLKRVLEKTEQITREIIPYITEAERFVNYSGAEKKEYVMTKINQYALENHIKFNQEEISKRIEELVALTKEVNVKDISINEMIIQNEIENNSKMQIEQKIKDLIEGMKK